MNIVPIKRHRIGCSLILKGAVLLHFVFILFYLLLYDFSRYYSAFLFREAKNKRKIAIVLKSASHREAHDDKNSL